LRILYPSFKSPLMRVMRNTNPKYTMIVNNIIFNMGWSRGRRSIIYNIILNKLFVVNFTYTLPSVFDLKFLNTTKPFSPKTMDDLNNQQGPSNVPMETGNHSQNQMNNVDIVDRGITMEELEHVMQMSNVFSDAQHKCVRSILLNNALNADLNLPTMLFDVLKTPISRMQTNTLLNISKQRHDWSNNQNHQQNYNSNNGPSRSKSSYNKPKNSNFKPKKFNRYRRFKGSENSRTDNGAEIKQLLNEKISTLTTNNTDLSAKLVKEKSEVDKLQRKLKMMTAERNVLQDRLQAIKLLNRDIKVKQSGYLEPTITDDELKTELNRMGLTGSRNNIELEM